jgi:ceramide glucosyltransferase
MIFAAAAAVALAYQLVALAMIVRHRRKRDALHPAPAAVSILKPLYGLDDGFREAIRSHVAQDHPGFEILFGVRRDDEPATAEIERLMRDFPDRRIRLVRCTTEAPNGKTGALIDLAREASHEVLVVSDSDITVTPDYLRRVTAPLADPRIGVVTCLYRATASTAAGRWEALGIATGFVPGVLVAPLAGVRDIGLGATLAFRKTDLARAGGFEAIRDYLADDNALARAIARPGLRVFLSRMVVETNLGGPSWADVWRRQLRWHRTMRVVNRAGYCGLPVTFATVWAIAAAVAGWWGLAAAALAARLAAAVAAGALLGCGMTARWWWLVPACDLWGVALWIAGLFGDTVVWRGLRLRIDREGRIVGQ